MAFTKEQHSISVVSYEEGDMMDYSREGDGDGDEYDDEVLTLSDDELRALMIEADQSLQRAQDLQRAALLHLYHSDSSAATAAIASSTTTTTTSTLDESILSSATTLGEGSLFRLATALSYYKESTVHMTRYQQLQNKIARSSESSSRSAVLLNPNSSSRWNESSRTTFQPATTN